MASLLPRPGMFSGNDGLFLDEGFAPKFEKIASPIKLSDNPDKWQSEVSTQVYVHLPYISDYAINVVLDRVNAERGAALGRIEVTPKSEAVTGGEQNGLPKALIPLVITDRLLQPLDVYMDGEGVYPLNERRLRKALMRTQAFESSSRKPVDQGMVDQLYPPMRTNYGNSASTGTSMGGFGKYASLLEAIGPTIAPADADAFVDRISKDRELQLMAERNPEFKKLAFFIAQTPQHGIEKTAEALVDSIVPTTVQLTKLANGNFRVRYANRQAYLVKTAEASPEVASGIAGTDKVTEMGPGDTVTVSTDKAKKQTLDDEKIETIDDFGQYRVQVDASNQPAVGWVLPIMDFDMHPLPLFLFTNGEIYSVQEDIAGSRVGHNLGMPEGQPEGDGCFFYVSNERATAFIPLTILHQMTYPGGAIGFAAKTMFDDPIELHMSEGLTTIQELEVGKYAIPTEMKWMPLGQAVHLIKDPAQMAMVQEAQQMGGQVEMGSTGGDEVSLEGQPLSKVAAADRHFMRPVDAEFLLVTMGANPFEVREKLAHARRFGKAKMAGLLPITPLADLHREMVKKAAHVLANFPYDLRRDLIKEAAALADSETADKLLSLNFLNAENLQTFTDFLPELDAASCKLAQLLMASRLGQSQIPQEAAERGMKHLEDVVAGLSALQQKQEA